MYKLFLPLVILFTLPCVAQEKSQANKSRKELHRQKIDEIAKQEEEGVIKYKKHTVFGAKLTSDGYGGSLEFGRARSVRKALLFQLDITERKHVKERKELPGQFQTSPTIYGKVNYFYPVKLGVQQQLLLGNKSNKNGVSVTANFGGGLSLGLLRPYIIEVLTADEKLLDVTFESDPIEFFTLDHHHHGPTLFKGWDQLTVVPGIYVKPSVRFDYGKYNEMVNAIEVGLTAEYFSKKIEQMAFIEPKSFFIGGYVSILLGRRR